MVEYRGASLDGTYHALSHELRRDVLQRLSAGPARISDLAAPADMSFAAVSKHVAVLESTGLLRRSIKGREHWLELEPTTLQPAALWLDGYRRFWEASLDRLERELRKRPR
ncbi:MAG TPA: metalloregulator ArsR/SmtB family transcription factor [Candidatus Dormibacteraeota bacterium]|nr:metalloregulator ArsR/SmtB family transcription factor [Candidatus Dormibacteraeota bacterium]